MTVNNIAFKKFIFLLFYSCPVFIVLGPFFINFYSVILCLFCIYFYFKYNLKIFLFNYQKIFLLFCLYLLFMSLFYQNFYGVIKSISLLSFLFTWVVLKA